MTDEQILHSYHRSEELSTLSYLSLTKKQRLDRLIEKVYDKYEELAADYGVSDFYRVKDEMGALLDSLQSLPTQNEWIPVSERSPNYNESVLVYRPEKIGANSMFTVIWDDAQYFKSIGVTHWKYILPTTN